MVLRYCFGITMSVSTLMIFRGAATPSSVVNLSIDRTSWLEINEKRFGSWFIANAAGIKGQIARIPQKHAVGLDARVDTGFANRYAQKMLNQRRPRSPPCRRRIAQN